MPNVFLSLPVPAGNGVGAWVDVSSQGPERTIVVDGGAFDGQLTIEGSNDAQASALPTAVAPFTSSAATPQTFVQAWNFLRVRRSSSSGAGTPNVNVSAPAAVASVFAAMTVPPADGTGASTSIAGGGDVNTFGVTAGFTGSLAIETSADGVNFTPTMLFTGGLGGAQNFVGVLSAARVRRTGTIGGPAPLVSVGSSATSGAAGTFPGYGPAPPAIAAASAAGVALTVSRSDHTHAAPNPGGSVTVAVFVDNDAGNDLNPGTSGSPVKTFDGGVYRLVPSDGLGAVLSINCRPRAGNAVYKKADGVTDENLAILSRITNYASANIAGNWFIGGTPSQGAVPATGTNVAGYDVLAGAAGNTLSCTLHGGGAPALPTGEALTMLRIRFDSAAPTQPALRNVVRYIMVNTASQVTYDTVLPVEPVAGDRFYVEMNGFNCGNVVQGGTVPLTLAGVGTTGFLQLADFVTMALTFCQSAGFTFTGTSRITTSGTRCGSGVSYINVTGAAAQSAGYAGSGFLFRNCVNPTMRTFVSGDLITFENCSTVSGNVPGFTPAGQGSYTVGEAPGSDEFAANSTSRIINHGIASTLSNLSVGRMSMEISNAVVNFVFAVSLAGYNNSLLVDGVTFTNQASGLVEMSLGDTAMLGMGNLICFGATQAGKFQSGVISAADIHVCSVNPVTGAFDDQFTLMLDTLTYAGHVTDGYGNRYVSANASGAGGVVARHMIYNPAQAFPTFPPSTNDPGRFKVVRATTSLGLLNLADASSAGNAANIVGVNIDSLPEPPADTGYDRYGSALVVSEGLVPIFCVDVAPTVPGPVWLVQDATYPQGVVTTVAPVGGTVVKIGIATAVLASPWSQSSQFPTVPNPNTITGTLLRVRLGAMGA